MTQDTIIKKHLEQMARDWRDGEIFGDKSLRDTHQTQIDNLATDFINIVEPTEELRRSYKTYYETCKQTEECVGL